MGIREVAKMASVSTATVSRLLTGAARVSPETANRIIEAMQALNFQPNEAARILAVLKRLKYSARGSSVRPEGVRGRDEDRSPVPGTSGF
jgi:hypothetical protein